MDEINENETSTVKKAAKLANDAIVITTIAVSVIGLGKLAYDTGEVAYEKIRAWKNSKKTKKIEN